MLTIGLYLILSPLLLTLALIFRKFIPRQINKIYGYRTRRSMQNDITWAEANDYATKMFIYITIGLNMVQILCFMLFRQEHAFLVTSLAIIAGVIPIIPLTEAHLKRRFPENG